MEKGHYVESTERKPLEAFVCKRNLF